MSDKCKWCKNEIESDVVGFHHLKNSDYCKCGHMAEPSTEGTQAAQPECGLKTTPEQRSSYRDSDGAYLKRSSAVELLDDIDALLSQVKKLKRQAEGQCDGCGELLEDSFCRKCCYGVPAPVAQVDAGKQKVDWDTQFPCRGSAVSQVIERIARLEQQLANARRDALKYIAQEAARKATKELFSFMDIKFERGKSYANSREETVAIVIEQNIRALIDKEPS